MRARARTRILGSLWLAIVVLLPSQILIDQRCGSIQRVFRAPTAQFDLLDRFAELRVAVAEFVEDRNRARVLERIHQHLRVRRCLGVCPFA